MTFKNEEQPQIGLVELPDAGLLAPDGTNWSTLRRRVSLISKQILMANLQASGFNTQLVHLKDGDYQEEFGKAIWRNLQFKKVYRGQKIEMVNPSAYDAWGITSNFSQHREVACSRRKTGHRGRL